MQVKKLEKLKKHLKTLHLFKTKKLSSFGYVAYNSTLPDDKQDTTRFTISEWEFDCGMPACVAGHAKFIFKWTKFDWDFKFKDFFGLSEKEKNWITEVGSYKSLNPTPKTAAKHIEDVLTGKFKEKANGKS